MKIVIIHGQNHKGSTCMIAQELANKIMRSIQSNYDERMYISISFQKKHT